jgi:hypothetical protein
MEHEYKQYKSERGGDINCDPGRDNRSKGGFDAIVFGHLTFSGS